MTSRAALAVLAAFLGACASTPEEAPMKKMTVTQKGLGSGAEYVACVDCPEPTRKMAHLPPPPKPMPVKKSEVEAPKPIITTRKVHFRFGLATLDKAGREELTSIVAEAKKGEKIFVLGRTDPVGSKRFNERLAIKRAETVRDEFIATGIPAASIHAGTHHPCCEGDLKGGAALHRELRRSDVEITIKTTR